MANDEAEMTEARAAAGRAILALTDRAGFGAYAAAWVHDAETDRWIYILVTPMLKSRGPRWIYDRLLRLFHRYPLPDGVTPLDIYAIDPVVESAAFGPVEQGIGFEDRSLSPGAPLHFSVSLHTDNLLVPRGTAFFFRRVPEHSRRPDPARRFEAGLRQLLQAA